MAIEAFLPTKVNSPAEGYFAARPSLSVPHFICVHHGYFSVNKHSHSKTKPKLSDYSTKNYRYAPINPGATE
jgi:hypothetical protein